MLINAQQFTKTAACWGVDNNAKGTNTNRIVALPSGRVTTPCVTPTQDCAFEFDPEALLC